jgi:radical SAM protein with 4Fe4S-binding SPASM domain
MSSITKHLPEDSTLLPLFEGALLVSPKKAVFCRVPPAEVQAARRVVCRQTGFSSLSEGLRRALSEHGFFGPDRPADPVIPTVQLQLTNECNLECSYCCTGSGQKRSQEITFEQARSAVRQARDVLGPGGRVSLLGGEPLLVPWATRLASEMLDLELDLCVFTNGLPLVEGEVAKRVASLTDRGAEVRVSLAGPTQPLCDTLSGTRRFDLALQGLRELDRRGGEANVDLMLVPADVEAVAESFNELKRSLPEGFPLALGVMYLGGRERGEHIFESAEDLERALDLITFTAGETIPAPRPSPLACRREGCSCALGHHLHVRSDGALFPCFKMEEMVGSLETTGFGRAYEANRTNPHPARRLEVCRECALNTLCGGGCRSENLLYTGDPDVPLCDDWRVSVISELLADDRPDAMEWPLAHLAAEARRRGIPAPEMLVPVRQSRHVW